MAGYARPSPFPLDRYRGKSTNDRRMDAIRMAQDLAPKMIRFLDSVVDDDQHPIEQRLRATDMVLKAAKVYDSRQDEHGDGNTIRAIFTWILSGQAIDQLPPALQAGGDALLPGPDSGRELGPQDR